MSYEFRMISRVNAERVDVFMSGRLAAFVNVFRSEMIFNKVRRLDRRFCSTVSNWMLLAAVV